MENYLEAIPKSWKTVIRQDTNTPTSTKPRDITKAICASRSLPVCSSNEPGIIEENCNCAGVFVVKDCGDDQPQVLLVESKRKNYQYSFPKGKRNKGESTVETAKRELYEETGLVEDDYELFPEQWYVEHRSDTGKPHIVYYMAHLKNREVILNPIDTKEIVSAKWFTTDDIYGMRRSFYLQRRQITTRAVRDYKMRSLVRFTGAPSRDQCRHESSVNAPKPRTTNGSSSSTSLTNEPSLSFSA